MPRSLEKKTGASFHLCAGMLIFLSASLSLCAAPSAAPSAADDAALLREAHAIFLEGKAHPGPAKYHTDLLGGSACQNAAGTLRNSHPTPEEARKVIRSYIETARRDSRWDYSPPRLNIPSAKRPIRIDGIAEEFEWENALTLRGQYAIGERKPDTRDNPVWRLLWDRRYLYLSAVFRNTQYRQVGKMPYEADCLEVFLRIDRRIGLYWELVVNFENRVLCDYRSLNYWGGFHDHRMPPDLFPGLQYRSRIRDGILTIEIAVPWKLFPGFANTRSADSPKKGEEVLFSLVRILSRSDSDRLDYCSAVPLLYGGHNLYGQITGILN